MKFILGIRKFFIQAFKLIIDRLGLVLTKKNKIYLDDNFNYLKLNLLNSNIILGYKIRDLITTAGKKLGSDEDPYYYALKQSLPLKEKNYLFNYFRKILKVKLQPHELQLRQ